MSKLVILGRDGIINHYQGHAITCADEWIPIPGSLQAIARLNQADYRVAVVTNQPGLASGLYDLDALSAIHHKLHDMLDRLGGHVDVVAFCPHDDGHGCDCRTPATGLLVEIAERFGVELSGVPMVVNSKNDTEAALAVGARPLLVRPGTATLTEPDLIEDEQWVFDDLSHAITALLVEE